MKDANEISDLLLSVDSLHGNDINTRVCGPWRNVPPIPETNIQRNVQEMNKSISSKCNASQWHNSIHICCQKNHLCMHTHLIVVLSIYTCLCDAM